MWTAAQSPNTPKYIRTEMLKLISQSARVLPQPMTLEFLHAICESLRKPFDKDAPTKADDQHETAIVDCLLPLLRNMKSDGLITEDTLKLEGAPQHMASELLWRTMWAVNRCNYGFACADDDAVADPEALRTAVLSGLEALNPHLHFVMEMFEEVVEQVDDAAMHSYYKTCIECLRTTSEAPMSNATMNQAITSAVAVIRLLGRMLSRRGEFYHDLSAFFAKDSVVLNWLAYFCSSENKFTNTLVMGVAVSAIFELLSMMHMCQSHLDFKFLQMIWKLTWPRHGVIRDALYIWLTSISKLTTVSKADKLMVLSELLMNSYDSKTLEDATSVGFECFYQYFCVCNNQHIIMEENKRGDMVIMDVTNVNDLVGHSCLWKLCLHVPQATFRTAMVLICNMYNHISSETIRERFCDFVGTWALESIKNGTDLQVSRVVKVFNRLLGVSLKPEALHPHCGGDNARISVKVELPNRVTPLLFELYTNADQTFYKLRQWVRKKLNETMGKSVIADDLFWLGKRLLKGNHMTLRALGIRDGDTITAKKRRPPHRTYPKCVGEGALWRLLSKDEHLFNALLRYLEKSCDSDAIDQEVWNFLMAIPTNTMFQKTFEQSPEDLDWAKLFTSKRLVDGKQESQFFRVVYLLQVLEKYKMNTTDGSNLWRSQFLASAGLPIIFDFLMNMDIHRENGQVDPIRRIGLITTLRVINYFMNGPTAVISMEDDDDANADKV